MRFITPLMLAVLGLACPAVAQTTRPYNVVVIMADDLGANELACYGNTTNKTPNLDRLASEGTRFAAPDLAWLEAGSVQLKGKAQRLRVYILVGDAALAQSDGFRALATAHDALLTALHDGGDVAAAIARCIELGTPIERRLARFYELVPGRADDFAAPSSA